MKNKKIRFIEMLISFRFFFENIFIFFEFENIKKQKKTNKVNNLIMSPRSGIRTIAKFGKIVNMSLQILLVLVTIACGDDATGIVVVVVDVVVVVVVVAIGKTALKFANDV